MSLKMVVLVNTDLKMGKGKACAQVGHACLKALELADEEKAKRWNEEGYMKVILKSTEKKMNETMEKLNDAGIKYFEVHDFGKTQVEPNSFTALGIEPVEKEKIDPITREFKLF